MGKTGFKVQLGRREGRRAILIRWIFRKWNIGVCPESRRLRIGTGGLCVCVFVKKYSLIILYSYH